MHRHPMSDKPEFRNLVIVHEGQTIELVNKALYDELSGQLRVAESRVAMLKGELDNSDLRIRSLVEQNTRLLNILKGVV